MNKTVRHGRSEAPLARAGGIRRKRHLLSTTVLFHMLADYFPAGRRYRHRGPAHSRQEMLKQNGWDLLVLSPGPGRPEDFAISRTIGTALDKKLPIFGVCLGVQAIGEYFGRAARPARPARAWAAVAKFR